MGRVHFHGDPTSPTLPTRVTLALHPGLALRLLVNRMDLCSASGGHVPHRDPLFRRISDLAGTITSAS